MGLFSNKKKKEKDDFFQSLADDVQKVRENDFMKLSDFSKNDFHKNTESSSSTGSPLDSIIKKVSKVSDFEDNSDNKSFEKKIQDSISESESNAEIESDITEITAIKSEETFFSETLEKSDDSTTDTKTDNSKINDEIFSLLEKCKAYTKDESGIDVSEYQKPLYELESVAEILKTSSFGALDSLSKKYNIVIEDETEIKTEEHEIKKAETESEDSKSEDTGSFAENYINISENTEKPDKSSDAILEDYILTKEPEVAVEKFSTNIPDISDIDNNQKLLPNDEIPETTSTIRFTPVKSDEDKNSKMSVSNITSTFDFNKILDFTDKEDDKPASNSLEVSEFEEYEAKNEVKSFTEIKQLMKKLSFKKRNTFLLTVLSFLTAVFNLFFLFNAFGDNLIANPSKTILICFIPLFISIIANGDMFVNVFKKYGKFSTADLSAVIVSISASVLAITEIKLNSSEYSVNVYHIILISTCILFVRSLMKFYFISSELGNLKQISSEKIKKNAITFIDDQSITFAMSKDLIENDVMLAAPQTTDFIDDFVKYSDYNLILGGKYFILQIISVFLALLSGIVAHIYFKDIIASFYCFASIVTVFSLPPLFFINALPVFNGSGKLNQVGAMVAGSKGAEQLEKANAISLSTSEIFPEGSIVLKDLKILSDGNIDEVILKAASLTMAVDSTLYPVFKNIAKTNTDYVLPDSDSVKYEEHLGISGWINNEMLFIGNRSLMLSHGIEIPDFEIDKKILSKGYFPVYLATVNKAYALLALEYNPSYSIAKQLKKTTNLGVAILFSNSDPNITEEMIADNFGLYDDTIKIVSNAGLNLFNNVVKDVDTFSSPASFKRKNLAFLKIINVASSIKKSNTLFSITYLLGSVFLSLAFLYLAFASDSGVPSSLYLLLSELGITLISLIIYLFKKP